MAAILYVFTSTDGSAEITIQPQTVDGPLGFPRTDLTYYGNATPNWGREFNRNFYHLLENFATDPTAPGSGVPKTQSTLGIDSKTQFPLGINAPVRGMSWYNKVDKQLHTFDGSSWMIANEDYFASKTELEAVSGPGGELDELRDEVWKTGDIRATIRQDAFDDDGGWIMLDDTTVGNDSSVANWKPSDVTGYTTEQLFEVLWDLPAAHVQLYDSGGTPVARGVSAAADWTANRRIDLPKVLGRVLGAAGLGASLTTRDLGETFGEEDHILTEGELASHDHGGLTGLDGSHTHTGSTSSDGNHFHSGDGYPGPAGGPIESGTEYGLNNDSGNTGSAGIHNHTLTINAAGSDHTHTISTAGSDQAHNTMQPTLFVNFMIKL